jgi:hypothetical protein
MRRTRRRVLELGAVAVAGGFAGCPTGGTDSDGDSLGQDGTPTDGRDESVATTTDAETEAGVEAETSTPETGRPETALAGYTEWLPAPSAPFVSDVGYQFRASTPAQLVELRDVLGDGVVSAFTRGSTVPGFDTLADARVFLRLARSTVVFEGDFDRRVVETELEDRGFSGDGTYRGFTMFTVGGSSADTGFDAVAVGDGSMVLALQATEDTPGGRSATEAVVDARTGNTERYAEAVPDCERLVDALGNAHVVAGRTHGTGIGFEDSVGEGTATYVGTDRSSIRGVVVFTDRPDEATETALRAWAADAETFRGQVPSSRVDGRVVVADTSVPTGEINRFYSELPNPPFAGAGGSGLIPAAEFRFEYEEAGNGRGLATISHDGGNTIPSDELFVLGSGFADVDGAHQTTAGEWQGTVSGDHDRVVPADYVTVGATDEFKFDVVWEDTHVNSSATLAEGRGPEL